MRKGMRGCIFLRRCIWPTHRRHFGFQQPPRRSKISSALKSSSNRLPPLIPPCTLHSGGNLSATLCTVVAIYLPPKFISSLGLCHKTSKLDPNCQKCWRQISLLSYFADFSPVYSGDNLSATQVDLHAGRCH